MATSFVTFVKPFIHHKTNTPSISNQRTTGLRRNNVLRVNAIAKKFEPSKNYIRKSLAGFAWPPLQQVVPQADRVLIKLEELPQKSAGGVLLPKSAVKFERYLMGEVISVGTDAGKVNTGKKVIFSDINAYEVDLGTEERHCFCKAGDLLAAVE